MKRFATLAFGLFILASGSGCCCLGPLFGMPSGGGYGGGCQPCGGAYGGATGYQASPCGPGGCGNGAYAPNAMAPTAYYPGTVQQAGAYYPYQSASMLNPIPTL